MYRISIRVELEEYRKDLLVDALAEAGFEAFEDNDLGLAAYCPDSLFDETRLATILPNEAKYRVEQLDDNLWQRFI